MVAYIGSRQTLPSPNKRPPQGVFIILSMGIGLCFLLFLAEKIHSRFVGWKEGAASPKESSSSPTKPDPTPFRADYASFAPSGAGGIAAMNAVTTSEDGGFSTLQMTRSGGATGEKIGVITSSIGKRVGSASLPTSPPVAVRKGWSWDSDEDEVYDRSHFHLTFG